MKVLRLSTLLIGSSLLLPASMLAANTTKKTLHLYEQVTVNGTQLSPGDYRVEWNGSGPNVKIDIMKGHDTIATASAQVVSEQEPNNQDGYTLKPGQNGTQQLAQVFFNGERFDLNLTSAGSNGGSGGAPSGSN